MSARYPRLAEVEYVCHNDEYLRAGTIGTTLWPMDADEAWIKIDGNSGLYDEPHRRWSFRQYVDEPCMYCECTGRVFDEYRGYDACSNCGAI